MEILRSWRVAYMCTIPRGSLSVRPLGSLETPPPSITGVPPGTLSCATRQCPPTIISGVSPGTLSCANRQPPAHHHQRCPTRHSLMRNPLVPTAAAITTACIHGHKCTQMALHCELLRLGVPGEACYPYFLFVVICYSRGCEILWLWAASVCARGLVYSDRRNRWEPSERPPSALACHDACKQPGAAPRSVARRSRQPALCCWRAPGRLSGRRQLESNAAVIQASTYRRRVGAAVGG